MMMIVLSWGSLVGWVGGFIEYQWILVLGAGWGAGPVFSLVQSSFLEVYGLDNHHILVMGL